MADDDDEDKNNSFVVGRVIDKIKASATNRYKNLKILWKTKKNEKYCNCQHYSDHEGNTPLENNRIMIIMPRAK